MKLYPSCRERILVKPAEKGPGAMYLWQVTTTQQILKSLIIKQDPIEPLLAPGHVSPPGRRRV